MNWKEVLCLDEQVQLRLPEDWNRPSSSIVEKKFPYREKPQEIFACPNVRHMITFNILEKSLHEQQIYPAISEIQRSISHIYPESIYRSSRLIKMESGSVGYFSFITGGIGSDSCHYFFILSVKGKMMLGSYHSSEYQIKEEEQFFFEVLRSIKVCGNGEGDKSNRHEENGAHR